MLSGTIVNNMGIFKKTVGRNRLTGMCHFKITNNVCYINNLFVDYKFRNNKIGSLLLRRVEDYLKFNTQALTVKVNVKNYSQDSTYDFYTKNGYKIKHEHEKLYVDDFGEYNIITLEKPVYNFSVYSKQF